MNIILSTSSGVPIYIQICNSIKEAITKGDLLNDEPLPSIRSLASEIKVSVITTKRAFDELEKEGFIYTIPGKGSFVSPTNMEVIKEYKMQEIEESLQKALDIAKLINVTEDELIETLKTLNTIN